MNKMDWHFPKFEDLASAMEKMQEMEWADGFVSGMFNFWDQMIKMEDASIASCKKQWNQFFEYMMEMQDTASALLPESVPTVAGLPSVNPKEFAEKMKEFQEMANKHFVAQTDAMNEFRKDSQEKVRDLVDTTVKTVKKRAKKAKAKDEAKTEEVKEEVANAEEAPKAEEKKEAPKAAEKKEAPKAAEKKEAPKAAEKKEAPKAAEKKEAAPKAEEKK